MILSVYRMDRRVVARSNEIFNAGVTTSRVVLLAF